MISLSVCVVASDADAAKVSITRRSLEGYTDDLVVTSAPEGAFDKGATRTAALARCRHDWVLALDPGETVDPAAWARIRESLSGVQGEVAIGVVRVLRRRHNGDEDEVLRDMIGRVVRRSSGARFEGEVMDRSVGGDAQTVVIDATILGVSREPAEDARRLERELGAKPHDPWVHLRIAQALFDLGTEPARAVNHAIIALQTMPLDAPEAAQSVITAAEALFVVGAFAEVIRLAESSRERFPRLTELRLIEALAWGSTGENEKMVAALDACLTLGEDSLGPGTIGAGTLLPWIHLAGLAERRADLAAARALYVRALPLKQAKKRLDDIEASLVSRADVPARLFDDGMIAMKACRHGSFIYPVRDTFIGRSLDLYGEWCEAELDTLGPLIREGDVVVDVGANIGTHAVFFGQRVGSKGRVIALEPQGVAYKLLAANVARNDLGDVVMCLREAAGDQEGVVAIPVVDPSTAVNFGAVAVRTGGAGTEPVKLRAIDSLDLSRCDLLKIDVEGLEPEVLAGARETIARHQPILFVENNTVEGSARLLKAIRDLGYEAYWHIARYYRAENFFKNPHDVFSIYQPEANLLCAPKGRSVAEHLIPVAGEDDDFVKAIGRARAA